MAARKRKPREAGDPSKGVRDLYPEGVPLDANGFPKEGADITPEVARRIPFDKQSARYAAQHKAIMEQKAQGKSGVKWHAVARIKFQEIKEFQPQSIVSVEQIAPFEDKSIPPRPIQTFGSIDDLYDYVKQVHWQGSAATYEWTAGDSTQPQWGQDRFSFGPRQEDDDMARQNQPPGYYPPPGAQQQQQQQWQQTPFGWWHPQFGYHQQPPGPPQPPPQQAPPQPAPAPQQPPPPQIVFAPTPPAVPPGVPADAMTQYMQLAIQQAAQIATLQEQLRQQPQAQQAPPQQSQPQQWVPTPDGRMWHPQLGFFPPQPAQGAVAGAPAAAEPPKPKSLVEEANDSFMQMRTLLSIGRKVAAEFNPQVDAPDDGPGSAQPPEQNPLKVQEVGPVRYVTRPDNSPVDATTQFMFNLDKIADFGKEALKQVRETMKERSDAVAKVEGAQEGQGQRQLSAKDVDEERALQRAERLVELQERAARAQTVLSQPPTSPQRTAPPPQAAPQNVPPRPEPPPAPTYAPPPEPPPPPAYAPPPPPAQSEPAPPGELDEELDDEADYDGDDEPEPQPEPQPQP